MRHKVYLAGPISGLTFDDADEWRLLAMEQLGRHSIAGISPLRGKSYLRALGELSAGCSFEGEAGLMSKPRSIMARDYYDCTTCDVLLVNLLRACKVSIGTMMEIAWAHHARIPVVCAMEPGNLHEHAMVNEAVDFRVDSLDKAIAVVIAILDPHTPEVRA